MSALATFWSEHQLAAWTIIAGAVSNICCALLGCYLVLRRLSLLGDAISHAILPGIVVAYVFCGRAVLPAFAAAVAVGMLTSLGTQTLSSLGRVAEDSSMGLIFTSLFALGVFLLTNLARNVDLDPGCVLYGAIEFVPLDTISMGGMEIPRAMFPLTFALAACLVFIVLFWKELKIAAFDEGLARAMGLRPTLIHYLLMAMVAAVTVAAFEEVGSILVIAMLIVPAAAAHMLCDRLVSMLLIASAIGVSSAVLGYFGAVYLDTTVAGMMAVAAGAQFVAAVALAPKHGLASKALATLALSMRIVAEDIMALLYRAEELAPRAGEPRPLSYGHCVRAVGGGLAAWLAVPMLWLQGRLVIGRGSLKLSDSGRQRARSLVRAHRLWEAFLVEYFRLPLDHLHAPAERVEHFIGPELQERLAAVLGTTSVDPHGREIPAPSDRPPTIEKEHRDGSQPQS